MACCKLPANREFKLVPPGQQRRRHPRAQTAGATERPVRARHRRSHWRRVAAPIGGSARLPGGGSNTFGDLQAAIIIAHVKWMPTRAVLGCHDDISRGDRARGPAAQHTAGLRPGAMSMVTLPVAVSTVR